MTLIWVAAFNTAVPMVLAALLARSLGMTEKALTLVLDSLAALIYKTRLVLVRIQATVETINQSKLNFKMDIIINNIQIIGVKIKNVQKTLESEIPTSSGF